MAFIAHFRSPRLIPVRLISAMAMISASILPAAGQNGQDEREVYGARLGPQGAGNAVAARQVNRRIETRIDTRIHNRIERYRTKATNPGMAIAVSQAELAKPAVPASSTP